jgi:hypothetical protein
MPPAWRWWCCAAAATAELKDTDSEDLSESGAAVWATPALIVRIFRDLETAADGASLRQVCKQAAASLDWFDLMWCARADILKVQAAIKHHAFTTVPTARISRVIETNLSELWSCPPLLKWVVLQAAKQGDAELLELVLGKQQQQQQQQQEGELQPSGYSLLKREQQQQQSEPGETHVTHDKAHNEEQLCKAFREHEKTFWEDGEREYPPVLCGIAVLSSSHAFPTEGCTIWLTVIAAEEAVRSGQVKLLEHMLQQGWFEQAWRGSEDLGERPPQETGHSLWWCVGRVTRPKQQLAPAFLAAAAAGDLQVGKLLLNYCPDLLDHVLWINPDRIRDSFIMLSVVMAASQPEPCGPYLNLLSFVSQLHRNGFTGIDLERTRGSFLYNILLIQLCYRNQQHQPESLQMLLDLGVVSCDQEILYIPSDDLRPSKGYFEVHCPIIAAAVAEQNAAVVAVLVAAGAVLPEPGGGCRKLPFYYNDLQAVVSDLDEQVAAAGGGGGGGGVIGAAQYQKAADVLRGYCEEHGREKIDAFYVERVTGHVVYFV